MLRLLADLLVKAPQVITQRSSSASGLRIRDFLVEHVIKRCTHPLAPTESIAHEYNRTLTCSESQHGVRLCLAAAATTPHAESSLRDVVQPADDEQNATAANAKLVRLMAETLYMSLIMRFDESTHLAGSGSWTR
ncbi:hypothetical protein H4R19_000063 [Coemansia spiralis]|nr:hypothetical protein H4R19_000063 [Coemansia spiralis]